MPRTSRLLLVLLIAGLVAPAASQAAPRKAPFGLFGTTVAFPDVSTVDPRTAEHYPLMARSGVESARVVFSWDQVEAIEGTQNWSITDPVVRWATLAGLEILPMVMGTPQWASTRPSRGDFRIFPPRNFATYGAFLRKAIERYGPQGSFWAENPDVPARPIRHWQIWNEPSASYFWNSRNYRRTYPRLLRVAYRAVKRADRHAKVVMAGLASFVQEGGRQTTSWDDLAAMYRNGARGHFDVLALHPFSSDLRRVIRTIELNRRVMRRNRNGRKPIYLTELSWPAAKGRIPPRKSLGFDVSPGRQRRLLAAAYRRFVRDRGLRIKRAYWYVWATTYTPTTCGGQDESFQYSGLVRIACGNPTLAGSTRLLRSYQRVARRYQGCAKGDDARRCR